MDTDETQRHARALRTAMAEKGVTNGDLAGWMKRDSKTVGNWRNAKTYPNDADRAELARIFPGYDQGGDAVEAALARSPLHAHRRRAVMAEYERHLYEQEHEPRSG